MKQKGTRFFKKSINHLMAVMDPSFVGPEAYKTTKLETKNSL